MDSSSDDYGYGLDDEDEERTDQSDGEYVPPLDDDEPPPLQRHAPPRGNPAWIPYISPPRDQHPYRQHFIDAVDREPMAGPERDGVDWMRRAGPIPREGSHLRERLREGSSAERVDRVTRARRSDAGEGRAGPSRVQAAEDVVTVNSTDSDSDFEVTGSNIRAARPVARRAGTPGQARIEPVAYRRELAGMFLDTFRLDARSHGLKILTAADRPRRTYRSSTSWSTRYSDSRARYPLGRRTCRSAYTCG
jgi:hypothetical protein